MPLHSSNSSPSFSTSFLLIHFSVPTRLCVPSCAPRWVRGRQKRGCWLSRADHDEAFAIESNKTLGSLVHMTFFGAKRCFPWPPCSSRNNKVHLFCLEAQCWDVGCCLKRAPVPSSLGLRLRCVPHALLLEPVFLHLQKTVCRAEIKQKLLELVMDILIVLFCYL